MKNLGNLKYFLGIEVVRYMYVVISQRKYVLNLLQEMGMLVAKHVDTPMDPKLQSIVDQEDVLQNQWRQTDGWENELSHCYQAKYFFCYYYGEPNYEKVMFWLHGSRICNMRYLKRTPSKGILYQKSGHLNIKIMSL